jgi:asparagine synthase (glutamine-hydrolysing)
MCRGKEQLHPWGNINMPGIVGVISPRPAEQCQRLVEQMITSMLHQPSYACGTHSVVQLQIYGGWVAHQNSFAGQQVFTDPSGDITLLISGECFSDEAVLNATSAPESEKAGSADWLLSSYEHDGDRFFEKLNGLFSGLLIDRRRNKAFLFNDRYGLERIYWHENEDAFYFASEAKALLCVLPQVRKFELEGVAQYLAFGCTLGSRTLFRGVHILPPASVWRFEHRRHDNGRYFSAQTWESQPTLPPGSFEKDFAQTCQRILPRYVRFSSRLGISLTAGVDSRLIMACLPSVQPRPVCYTFSGEKKVTLDARIAAQVAAVCGLEHFVLTLGSDFFEQFASHADETVYVTDGTLGVIGAHEIYFNRQARRFSSERLTGVFGGEIMRGVSFFKPLKMSAGFLDGDLQRQVTSIQQEQGRKQEHPITFAVLNEIPQRRFGVPAAARSQIVFRTPYLDNDFVALSYRAPRGSIACRAEEALDFVSESNAALSSIGTDRGYVNGRRSFLRKALAETTFKLDYFYSEGLPSYATRLDPLFRGVMSALGVAGRYKFLYYRTWFQRELVPYLEERLNNSSIRQSSFWNTSSVDALMRDHRSGRANYLQEINAALTLEAVERLLLKPAWNSEKPAAFARQQTASASR